MTTTMQARPNSQERLRSLVAADLHEGDRVLADGRAAEIVRVERTSLGSIACQVRFDGREETKWVSPLHLRTERVEA